MPALSLPLAARLRASGRRAAVSALVVALGCGPLVLAFPERAMLTGDAAMRQGAFFDEPRPERVAPQALPADLWLHHRLPRAVAAATGLPAPRAVQLWGAALAAANALLAWRLAGLVAASGAGRLAAFAAAAFTGGFALFNGYAKAPAELQVLTLAAAGALLSVARTGRGALALGLATAAALLLHRGALALLPAWAAGLAWASRGGPRARWTAGAWLALLAPLAALAATGPRTLRTFADFDVTRHLGAAPGSGAGWLAASLSADRLHQASQALLLLAPLALPLAALLVAALVAGPGTRPAGGRDARRAEAWLLAALVVPQLALLAFVRPQQGLFRDWDVFAPLGAALAALAARLVAAAVDARPGAAWLAIPVALVAAASPVQWLALQSDAPRALERAAAILEGPPARPAAERAAGFDHVGWSWLERGEAGRARVSFARSLEAAPNPIVRVHAGMAEALLGRHAEALEHYLAAVRLNPNLLQGWKGVAASGSALGEHDAVALAARALERLDPGGESTRAAREYARRHGR